jgi:hypothetical protein
MVSAFINVISSFVRSNKVLVAFLGGGLTGYGATLVAPKMKQYINSKRAGKQG